MEIWQLNLNEIKLIIHMMHDLRLPSTEEEWILYIIALRISRKNHRNRKGKCIHWGFKTKFTTTCALLSKSTQYYRNSYNNLALYMSRIIRNLVSMILYIWNFYNQMASVAVGNPVQKIICDLYQTISLMTP